MGSRRRVSLVLVAVCCVIGTTSGAKHPSGNGFSGGVQFSAAATGNPPGSAVLVEHHASEGRRAEFALAA
jgi:hypothetical protein